MKIDDEFEASLVIRYVIEGEDILDKQSLYVIKLSDNKLMIRESSGLLDDYKLFFGDEIIVKPIENNEYEVESIVSPSSMRHFFWVTNGQPPKTISEFILSLGGNWECDAGGLVTLHIPRSEIEHFEKRVGNLSNSEEWFSGVQDF